MYENVPDDSVIADNVGVTVGGGVVVATANMGQVTHHPQVLASSHRQRVRYWGYCSETAAVT